MSTKIYLKNNLTIKNFSVYYNHSKEVVRVMPTMVQEVPEGCFAYIFYKRTYPLLDATIGLITYPITMTILFHILNNLSSF